MSDYKEQANSLREHADLIETSIELYGPSATRLLVYDLRDAAAAIEALQAEVKILKVSGREAYFEGMAAEAEPKRGGWIKHPEVKNIYGGVYIECPFCGEKYVVQNVSDEKFCRNCGADMRAKMEVQE